MTLALALDLIARWNEPHHARARASLLEGEHPPLLLDDIGRLDLRGIDLRRVHLRNVRWAHARLDFARLDGAVFDGVDAVSSTMRFASACESTWKHAHLAFADMSFANFAGATMSEARMRDVVLENAIFAGADLRASDMRGAFLRFADLEGAWRYGTLMSRAWPRVPWGADGIIMEHIESALVISQMMLLLASPRMVRAAEGLAWGARPLSRELMCAFRKGNWRHHGIAAAMAAAGADRVQGVPQMLEHVWWALEQGTRAGPQLVALAWLFDRDFTKNARALQSKIVGARNESTTMTSEALAVLDDAAGPASDDERAKHGAKLALTWLARLREHCSAEAKSVWLRGA